MVHLVGIIYLQSGEMASSDQMRLSSYIKSVHEKLRISSKSIGSDEAWREHCANEDNLKKYAKAMQELASNHWESNYKKSEKAISRVQWIHNYSLKYFSEIISQQRIRETEIALKMNIEIANEYINNQPCKQKLLDVGSCYNPFKAFDCFEVVPIDIAPSANCKVYKCDFLNVSLDSNPINVVHRTISALQIQSFDIVVFSLFVEYLPCPKQRLFSCKKAYQLLKPEGILVIITPDSKHVGANAKIMKTWRYLLAKMGFSRIKYEKLPYLHCMVFRKSLRIEIAARWATLQNEQKFYTEFVIPQDFNEDEKISAEENNSDVNNYEININLLEELPKL